MKSKSNITDKIYIEVKYDESLRYKCRVKLNIDGRFLKSSENILTSVLFIIKILILIIFLQLELKTLQLKL